MHGGVEKDDLKNEDLDALKKGMSNLERHIQNIKKFGLQLVVAINHFITTQIMKLKSFRSNALNLGSKQVSVHIGLMVEKEWKI